MLIRCEKCTTLYELDEKLLPPQGAPVQCSRCQFVFTAHPPRSEGSALVASAVAASTELAPTREPEQPAAAPPPPAEDADAPAGPPAEPPPANAEATAPPRHAAGRSGAQAPAPAVGAEPRFTSDGRPIRKVPFPAEVPAPPGPRSVNVQGARGGVRVKPVKRRPTWLLPLLLALAVAIGLAAWLLLVRRNGG